MDVLSGEDGFSRLCSISTRRRRNWRFERNNWGATGERRAAWEQRAEREEPEEVGRVGSNGQSGKNRKREKQKMGGAEKREGVVSGRSWCRGNMRIMWGPTSWDGLRP